MFPRRLINGNRPPLKAQQFGAGDGGDGADLVEDDVGDFAVEAD